MDIILPGDPEFYATLGTTLPPGWQNFRAQTNGEMAFVTRSGSCILEPVSFDELDDYLEGGEYEEVEAEQAVWDDELDE